MTRLSDDHPDLFREIHELADRVVSRRATPQEQQRLERLVTHNDEACTLYVDYMNETVAIRRHARIRQLAVHGRAGRSPALAALTSRRRRGPGRHSRVRYATMGISAIVAASLLFVWLAHQWNTGVNGAGNTIVVGSMTRSANVQWSAKGRRWSVGDVLVAGDAVEFDSGRLELEFASGAVMTAVGPAALTVQSASLVALDAGTATTRVDSAAAGEFRVVTPATEVLDLGTEFGVRVRPGGETDVVVFEGEVDVTPVAEALARPHPVERLSAGEAVCVGGRRGWRRLVSIDSDAFPFGDGIFSLSRSRPPVILRVRDNLSQASRPKFYSIVPGGFREGVKAYVDRSYEWRRLDGAPFPAELLEGDYIRTFNDDKRSNELEVVVTIGGPAVLYVLFDDRIPLPEWLEAGFVDTQIDIALREPRAEARFLRERAAHLNDGAAPQDVEHHRFSVWKREIREVSEIRLGRIGVRALRATVRGGSMYGVVAVPLGDSEV